MFNFKRKSKYSKSELEMDNSNDVEDQNPVLTEEERKTIVKIENDFSDARASRESALGDDDYYSLSDYSIEDEWEDDYKIFKGGGLQWSLKMAYRSSRARKRRPNSEDNFIFNTINIQHANITAETPTVGICGVGEEDKEVAKQLTEISRFNDNRNEFDKTWKRFVLDFITSGPTIAMVTWDNDWRGGRGPERWIGDVRVDRIDKWDMYFDPAITDLEKNLQECSYIIRRPRKKLKYIRDKWEKGRLVSEQENEDSLIDEGANPRQAYVIEYWHRGFPWFMPEERVRELKEMAEMYEQEGDLYKAKDYMDSAKGDLEGVHVAYVSDGVLLEYRTYEYEHGMYPFAFTTRYTDDKCQWGFGEIRNIKIPQIMHNKADEIEIEASSREGLGGKIYQKGAINEKQLHNILENNGKGGMYLEVDNVELIKDRTGVRVPASITNFKEHKQRVIDSVSNSTPIQKGLSPSSNMPFAAIQELGARSDVRMEQISNKLEDFLKDINKLRLELFAQFYTEERYYRLKDEDGENITGTFKADDMKKQWVRDERIETTLNEVTGEEEQKLVQDIETFVPEFDVNVTVMSEKPTDRNYYTQTALQLYQMQLMSPEDLLTTLEDGKMPPMDKIIEKYQIRNPIMGVLSQLEEFPEEYKQMVIQQMLAVVQQNMQQAQLMQDVPQTMPQDIQEMPQNIY